MSTTRTSELGPAARPVAVPANFDAPNVKHARGVVSLPLRVRWSGPHKTYDLAIRADKIRVYEQVLREGTENDVLYFIEHDELLQLWDDLVLPPNVRAAWASWFQTNRSVDIRC